jgi:hypothetical protein
MVQRMESLERTDRALRRLGLTSSAAESAYGRRNLLDGWFDENVTGTQSATKLFRFGNAEGWQRDAIMSRGGRVTGLSAGVSEARTAGTATVELYVNDVASGLQAVLDAGATVFTFESGDVSFEAGDKLSVYLTTAGWTPTTADLQVMIEVGFE